MFLLLLLLTTECISFSATYILNSSGDVVAKPFNLCQSPCSAACSPECMADCCVTKSELPCAPSSSPGVSRGATAYNSQSSGKPDMMISSVEEGETEECGERGIGSPTDNTADPPGTITIPLPPTMYTPPKPGEDSQELPLPDFHIPAAVLQGKMPDNSVTLSPIGTQQGLQGPETGKALPCITPPISSPPPAAPPPPPIMSPSPSPTLALATPLETPQVPPVHIPPPPPIHVAAAPPPCGVTQVMPSGGTLIYPKLPPVTVSEIPKKKIPLSLLNKLPLGHPMSALSTSRLQRPILPTALNCPAICSLHCGPDCRDECCKGGKVNTVLSSLHQPPTSLFSSSAAAVASSPAAARLVSSFSPAAHMAGSSLPAAHIVTSLPSSPPAAAAFSPPPLAAPCPHNADPDACVINFDPPAGASPPKLHAYPPSDMPTDVIEVNPLTVPLPIAAAIPALPTTVQSKSIDDNLMKEMEEKLNACDKSGFMQG